MEILLFILVHTSELTHYIKTCCYWLIIYDLCEDACVVLCAQHCMAVLEYCVLIVWLYV